MKGVVKGAPCDMTLLAISGGVCLVSDEQLPISQVIMFAEDTNWFTDAQQL